MFHRTVNQLSRHLPAHTTTSNPLLRRRMPVPDEKYSGLYRRTDTLTDQVRTLTKQVHLLKEKISNKDADAEVSPQLEQLQTMNQKLKYQKTMLERTLKEEKAKCCGRMFNIHSALMTLFQTAIDKAFPSVQNIPVVFDLGHESKVWRLSVQQCHGCNQDTQGSR